MITYRPLAAYTCGPTRARPGGEHSLVTYRRTCPVIPHRGPTRACPGGEHSLTTYRRTPHPTPRPHPGSTRWGAQFDNIQKRCYRPSFSAPGSPRSTGPTSTPITASAPRGATLWPLHRFIRWTNSTTPFFFATDGLAGPPRRHSESDHQSPFSMPSANLGRTTTSTCVTFVGRPNYCDFEPPFRLAFLPYILQHE